MTKAELERKLMASLNHEAINKPEHSGLKEGLTKALEIVKSDQKDFSGIEELSNTQSRAIAMFAVDFNNLKCNGKIFIELGKLLKRK